MDQEIKPVNFKNAIQCNICGDVIESKHRDDFKWCSCGSCAVDGGTNYLRRIGNLNDYTELSTPGDELLQD